MNCPYCKQDHDPGFMCDEKERQYFPGKFKSSATMKAKPNQSATNFLQDRIVQHVSEKGGFLWRINVGGFYREGKSHTNVIGQRITQKGSFITSGSTKGIPDLVGSLPGGRLFCVEIKTGKDRMRKAQEKCRDQVKQMGGIHLVVKTWEDYLFQFNRECHIN